MIGCGHNAKNKLTVNYLYLAEKYGAVGARTAGGPRTQAAARRRLRSSCPAPGLGAARGRPAPPHLHRGAGDSVGARLRFGQAAAPHEAQPARWPGLSDELGKRARTNSEQLLVPSPVPYDQLEAGAGTHPHHAGLGGHHLRGLGGHGDQHRAGVLRRGQRPVHAEAHLPPGGDAAAPHRRPCSSTLMEHPAKMLDNLDATTGPNAAITCCACRPPTPRSSVLEGRHAAQPARRGAAPPIHIPVVESLRHSAGGRRCAAKGSSLFSEVVNRTASAHFIGGIPIGERADQGVVDPFQRAFGQPRSACHRRQRDAARNPGVNPSLMITAMAERAMCSGRTRATPVAGPALGSGYQPLKAGDGGRARVPARRAGPCTSTQPRREVIPNTRFEANRAHEPENAMCEPPRSSSELDADRPVRVNDANPYYMASASRRVSVARVSRPPASPSTTSARTRLPALCRPADRHDLMCQWTALASTSPAGGIARGRRGATRYLRRCASGWAKSKFASDDSYKNSSTCPFPITPPWSPASAPSSSRRIPARWPGARPSSKRSRRCSPSTTTNLRRALERPAAQRHRRRPDGRRLLAKEADYALKHIDDWMKPQREPMPLVFEPGTSGCTVIRWA